MAGVSCPPTPPPCLCGHHRLDFCQAPRGYGLGPTSLEAALSCPESSLSICCPLYCGPFGASLPLPRKIPEGFLASEVASCGSFPGRFLVLVLALGVCSWLALSSAATCLHPVLAGTAWSAALASCIWCSVPTQACSGHLPAGTLGPCPNPLGHGECPCLQPALLAAACPVISALCEGSSSLVSLLPMGPARARRGPSLGAHRCALVLRVPALPGGTGCPV